MLQIVYFSQKDQFLADMGLIPGQKVYITPSPGKADGLRLLLDNGADADVLTIAKFTSQLLEEIWPQEPERPQLKRKAELLLIFGILKDRYLSNLGFEQFIQAYNLFSDLRSFSMNEEALAPVMEEQPEEIRKAVSLFWKLLDLTGYCDEHGTYHAVAEALRSGAEVAKSPRTYVFWGFQHLNGQQLDLLKALSIRYQVIIPFPSAIKSKLKRSDWLSWLKDNQCIERNLPERVPAPKATWLKVNSRELSQSLVQVLRPGDQVVLGVSKLTPSHIDLVPSNSVSFKIPHRLVQLELSELDSDFMDQSWENGTLAELENLLQLRRDKLIPQLGQTATYKQLKAIELYQHAISQIRELTDEEVKVDRFLLRLLYDVVSLNQPRSSYIPISENDLSIDLKDMSSLDEIRGERRVLLCVDERFDEIQSLGQNYSESVQKSLASLGPMKRSELELNFRRWEFLNLFTNSEVIVFMGENTLKHSIIWKRLFADIPLTPMPHPAIKMREAYRDRYLDFKKGNYSGTLSASKFQTYLDCPRRFFHTYVEKIFPSIVLSSDLDALAIGTISHRIIEVYFERGATLDMLPEICREVMQTHLQESSISLPLASSKRYELLFFHRATNGVRFLEQLEEVIGEKISWKIETSFNLAKDVAIRGKIDCVGFAGNKLILLDFKSTSSAASSFGEVANFESLQLWVYSLAAKSLFPDLPQRDVLMGYVSLNDPTESNLIATGDELFQTLKAAKLCSSQRFELPFNEALVEAEKFMSELARRIYTDTDYFARPRKVDSCRYCELKKVCTKGERGI